MPVALPITGEAESSVNIVLDDATYKFRVLWNSREGGGYFIYIKTASGASLVDGTRIALNKPIGARCADSRFPTGLLLAIDLSDSGVEAALGELGGRVQIYYWPKAEIATPELAANAGSSALGRSNGRSGQGDVPHL